MNDQVSPAAADCRLALSTQDSANQPAKQQTAAMPDYPDDLIKSILRSNRFIAMVGASGNDMRPSYFAMKYLLDKGFRIRPVNPGLAGKKILNQDVYASLKDVPAPIDIVDIFRGAEFAPKIVAEALQERQRLGVKVIWMQLGVVSEEAKAMAEAAGLTVIMDRCPKIEYGRLSGEIGWMGINRKVIDNRKPKLFSKGGSLMREDRPKAKEADRGTK